MELHAVCGRRKKRLVISNASKETSLSIETGSEDKSRAKRKRVPGKPNSDNNWCGEGGRLAHILGGPITSGRRAFCSS